MNMWMSFLSFLTVLVALFRSAGALSLSPSTTPSKKQWKIPSSAEVLCQDPLVYTIPDLLSPQECQQYQDYVEILRAKGRTMTRSNPPQVSVDVTKLWPLPFLSLGAGIPSVVKTVDDWSAKQDWMAQLINAAAFPVSIAMALSVALVLAAQPLVQAISNAKARTSVAMALNQVDDMDFVQPLVQRIVDSTGHDWDGWEAPVVTRYDPGSIFARHGDASPTLGSEWNDQGGQRVITCICYLNACPRGGGETYFDQLGLAVTPEPGKALVFFPAEYDSRRADDRTTHESLPPIQDEKWIVQLFGRVGPRVPPPLGLPDEFGSLS